MLLVDSGFIPPGLCMSSSEKTLLTSKQFRASKESFCIPENMQKVKIRFPQVLGTWRNIEKEMFLDGFLGVHA